MLDAGTFGARRNSTFALECHGPISGLVDFVVQIIGLEDLNYGRPKGKDETEILGYTETLEQEIVGMRPDGKLVRRGRIRVNHQ